MELLIAAAVAGIVLTVVGTFFATNARVSVDLQDRNELNVRLRAVAEGVAQDLQMAGSRAIVVGGVPEYVSGVGAPGDSGYVHSAVVGSADDYDTVEVSVFYASSLRPQIDSGDRCRNVVYRFNAETEELHRSDVDCSDADAPQAMEFGTLFARGITSVKLGFVCASDDPNDGAMGIAQSCFESGRRGIHGATIELSGRSLSGRNADRVESFDLSVTMPNTRVTGE